MINRRIDVINEFVDQSFGEGFRADLSKRIIYNPYACMPITSYEFGKNEADYIWKLNKIVEPLCWLRVKGRFAEPDGSKLLVPSKYLQNAEAYARLYRSKGLGEVEIEIRKGESKGTLIANIELNQEEFIEKILAKHGIGGSVVKK